MQFNSTREQVAFLARRATWGLAPGELDVLESLGVAATIERLVDPASAGLAEEASAWADWNCVRPVGPEGETATGHGGV